MCIELDREGSLFKYNLKKGNILAPAGAQRCKDLQMQQIYLCYFFHLVLIFGPFWVIFGPFGQFWVIFGPIWAVLGNFWAILGNLRSFLGHFLVLIFCGKILLCAI